ncbi:MAG TPA: hypothetical protein VF756_11305 [Thermoanaerobaculia bacterium]
MKTSRSVFLLLTLCLAAAAVEAQDPKGSELRINPRPAGTQWLPDVATAADGSFVVAWQEGGARVGEPVSVLARLFDATGRPRGGQIQVARYAARIFGDPAVAVAADGRFVVVWAGGTEEAPVVLGRRFAVDGQPLGSRFRLARGAARRQYSPDVAMAADGGFVAVWTQEVEGLGEVNADVFFRRFGPTGRPLGPEALAIGGYEEQSAPQVALRPDGGFVVACQTWNGESLFYDILARLFSRSGVPAGDEIPVNDSPYPESSQFGPALAVAPDGKFAIAWTDRAGDFGRVTDLPDTLGYTGVAVRFFAADGAPLRPSASANVFLPGVQENPAVSALQTGGFLVLWASGGGQDGDGSGIFARVYGANGQPRRREFRINLNRTGSQDLPALSIAPSGKGAAVWNGPDGDGAGIFARLLGIPGQGS